MGVTENEIVERAREMLPRLRDRAEETEKARSVPEASIKEFRDADFFKILQPAAFGGLEMSPTVLYDVVHEVSSACASSGWVLSVLAVHNWEAGLLSPRAQEEIWGENPHNLISSSYVPTGSAKAVDGGIELTGAWPFSSGCDHAQWAFIGCVIETAESNGPALHALAVPRESYTIEDDWHVFGLCGTGSKVLKLDKVFVPSHRCHPLAGSVVEKSADVSPLYHLHFGSVFIDAIGTPAIGIASGILGQFKERVKQRVGSLDGSKMAEEAQMHMRISEAEAVIDASRLQQKHNHQTMLENARNGIELTVEDRARYAWDATNAVRNCVNICDRLFEASGAHAIFLSNPLQRAFRDAHAVRAHAGLNSDLMGRNYGAVSLGMENTVALIG